MAWHMFKDSGTYQPRGKKCSGFHEQIRPKISLSWGMEQQISDNKSKYAYQIPIKQQKNTERHNYYESRKAGEEQLDKIMKKYQHKRVSYPEVTANQQIEPVLMEHRYPNNNALSRFINRQNNKNAFTVPNNNQRTSTQQSKQKMQFLQNSLLQPQTGLPQSRRDSIGALLNSNRAHQYDPMVQSRVSRRSSSGNKKNESAVVFGDGKYNEFTNSDTEPKDFHTKLMERYNYQTNKSRRKVSNIEL